jgi:hypothetical protein
MNEGIPNLAQLVDLNALQAAAAQLKGGAVIPSGAQPRTVPGNFFVLPNTNGAPPGSPANPMPMGCSMHLKSGDFSPSAQRPFIPDAKRFAFNVGAGAGIVAGFWDALETAGNEFLKGDGIYQHDYRDKRIKSIRFNLHITAGIGTIIGGITPDQYLSQQIRELLLNQLYVVGKFNRNLDNVFLAETPAADLVDRFTALNPAQKSVVNNDYWKFELAVDGEGRRNIDGLTLTDIKSADAIAVLAVVEIDGIFEEV